MRITISNVWIALRINLRTPVRVCAGERSLSKRTLIKKCLRSTMSDESLWSFAILFVDSEIAENFDWTTLVNKFEEI